jgi:hypothetical protein
MTLTSIVSLVARSGLDGLCLLDDSHDARLKFNFYGAVEACGFELAEQLDQFVHSPTVLATGLSRRPADLEIQFAPEFEVDLSGTPQHLGTIGGSGRQHVVQAREFPRPILEEPNLLV